MGYSFARHALVVNCTALQLHLAYRNMCLWSTKAVISNTYICSNRQQYIVWNLRVQNNLNIEKITFKVAQIKFLAMHITNQKLSFDIFTVGNIQNIFMEHDLK